MKLNRVLAMSVSALAFAAAGMSATAASAGQTYYPFKAGHLHANPDRSPGHVGPYARPYAGRKGSGTWADVGSLPFSNGGWGSMLLTDGTVIMLDYCTSPAQWYKLTPDAKGKYESGSWSKIAAMPTGYSPLFFAQQVMTDGRVIINGGEYNACSGDWTNQGALYDPVANSWTPVSPPSGWSTIGDAESIILPNGTYMLANCCDNPASDALASIGGTTVTWNKIAGISCPSGDPCNDEEAFNALPDGHVLLVDVWNSSQSSHYDDWWTFDPATDTWTLGGKTPDYLTNSGSELGPAALMPNGKIIQFGAGAHNDIFDTSTAKWSHGPSFPLSGYDCADAPAATLPSGHVLVQASPGEFNTPSHFFEFQYTPRGRAKLVQVNDPTQAPQHLFFRKHDAPSPDRPGSLEQQPGLAERSGDVHAAGLARGAVGCRWFPAFPALSRSGARAIRFRVPTSTASISAPTTATMPRRRQTSRSCASQTPAAATSALPAATTSRPWACGRRAPPMRRSTFPRPARQAQARSRLS